MRAKVAIVVVVVVMVERLILAFAVGATIDAGNALW